MLREIAVIAGFLLALLGIVGSVACAQKICARQAEETLRAIEDANETD